MLDAVKKRVRASPLGPIALKLYALLALHKPGLLDSRNNQYDRETVLVMRRVLSGSSNCIDIGAHQGSILREMLSIAPLGSHHAFEPLPHMAAELRHRFPQVAVHEAAVSNLAGTTSFIHVENAPGYSGLRTRVYDRPDPLLREITVKIVRLDDVIPPDQPIAFIKLDIEGGEFHALLGGLEMIRRCQPVIVFEAGEKSTGQYGALPDDFYQLLCKQLGYHLSTMNRWLTGITPYQSHEFETAWREETDYYFIAYPKNSRLL